MTITIPRCPALLALGLSLASWAAADQFAWQSAWTSSVTDATSEFLAVEAMADPAVPGATRAFLAGSFTKTFAIGGLPTTSSSKSAGLVVRMTGDEAGTWGFDWQATATSADGVRILDLAPSTDGAVIHVCGTGANLISFKNPSGTTTLTLQLPSGSIPFGFVARLDAQTGAWLGAFKTPWVWPEKLVTEAAGAVIVSGFGAMASKFSASGVEEWWAPPVISTRRLADIAINPDPADPNLYVMGELSTSESDQEVRVWQLDRASGALGWSLQMGSAGADLAGAIKVAPDGDLRLCYSAEHQQPLFAGQPVAGVPSGANAVSAQYAIAARVRADGGLVWATPLGQPADNHSHMVAHGIAVDPAGNTWLSVLAEKVWQVGGSTLPDIKNTIAAIAVDATGVLYDAYCSYGGKKKVGRAIAAPTRDLVFSAGSYTKDNSGFAPLPAMLSRNDSNGAYVAIARGAPGQQLLAFQANPDAPVPLTIPQLRAMLEAQGIRVYTEIEVDGQVTAISGYATPQQVAALATDTRVASEVEATMVPCGVTLDAGWGLARLNNGCCTTPPGVVQPYCFPEPSGPVVLYLVDTAVAEAGGWFAGNPNLTLEETVLIRGAGDPTTSTQFAHGTRMLSIVAGPQTGAAPATPVRVVNYDIYPNGPTTTSALLAKGVLAAVQRHRADPSGSPGVVCIAASSGAGATSLILRAAIDSAIAEGLLVVVSAGNAGDNASQYIPAAYGVDPGIVCVGASDPLNQRLAISNHGPAVDLFAPGEQVRTLCFDDPLSGGFDQITGTSASTAITSAAALIELSKCPGLTPATLETTLLSQAYQAGVSLVQILPPAGDRYRNWETNNGLPPDSPDDDPDGDQTCNLLEYLTGGNPQVADPQRTHLVISPTPAGLKLSFPIAADLFDPAHPQTLSDGTSWQFQYSQDLATWYPVDLGLTIGTEEDGRIPVSGTMVSTGGKVFLRLAATLPQ